MKVYLSSDIHPDKIKLTITSDDVQPVHEMRSFKIKIKNLSLTEIAEIQKKISEPRGSKRKMNEIQRVAKRKKFSDFASNFATDKLLTVDQITKSVSDVPVPCITTKATTRKKPYDRAPGCSLRITRSKSSLQTVIHFNKGR